MFSALVFILIALLAAVLGITVYNIFHGLVFQEPEVPATGATRSRSIQH
jgi:hypothetical protein